MKQYMAVILSPAQAKMTLQGLKKLDVSLFNSMQKVTHKTAIDEISIAIKNNEKS